MARFQALPAPVGRDAQHGIRQRAQVVGHLFHREASFDVAGKRAEHLGVVGASQQVQQRLVVVLAGAPQRTAPLLQLLLEDRRIEALGQH